MTAIPASAHTLWQFHTSVPACTETSFDVVICLGSYDESVARHAAALHLANPAGTLLFTGCCGNWTEGLYQTTEAEHFAEIARAAGVSDRRIVIEPKATNIGQNIALAEALLPADPGRTVFLTKPQTQRRLHLTLRRVSTLADYAVSAPERSLAEAVALFGTDRIVNEMVGDLDRVIKYPALGFMAEETVPGEVLAAFDDLVRLGFTQHVIKA